MAKYSQQPDPVNILSEPTVAYGQVSFYTLAAKATSKSYIKYLLGFTKMTVEELIELLPVSIDTYKRKKVFQPPVTEKILEIEEVYREGLDAFGEGFYQWMQTPNITFGNVPPKKLLQNSFGIRMLLQQIGRMQHGVLA
ncbi:antitoxin Xre/MbcA/ParS toxin-binding domain-containing protein [Marinoscillum furvescens]|uniref:Uncharacterized protein (DUF2384 family) n=1 Tax=Marinoscillum furvescens DSM 4134 TaxID=1122208 RepID=A0A3D9L6G8_MARFU|nr:antitoxin Xre/MbcA/ParS toxin-binding domain-containing protein [Marinoscillum furvescens]REE01757.1 uncharacterized protein (DUF2384 family) [Marinoscillum furvescens DSM 4134]